MYLYIGQSRKDTYWKLSTVAVTNWLQHQIKRAKGWSSDSVAAGNATKKQLNLQ